MWKSILIALLMPFVLVALVSCEGEELDNDAKRICNGFLRTFLGTGDYSRLFTTYYGEMERSIKTRKGGKIVRAILDLSDELRNPKRTSGSVRKIERQVLALCGFDVER